MTTPNTLSTAEKAGAERVMGVQIDGIQDHEVLLAAKAEDDEHRMTLREALSKHKKAAAWSAALSAALIMEGELSRYSTQQSWRL